MGSEKRQTCGLYGGLGSTSDSRCRPTLLSILVHSNAVGVIIGRGGSTIREIIRQTGVRIIVSKKDTVGILEKLITIYGTPENCTNACRKILEVVQQKATFTNKSDVTLRILIQDNLIGLIIGEEGNTIRNIMSETETKIYVFGIINITIDNNNYKRICIVEGSIGNISKAESQISAKLRQSFEKYLRPISGYQINIQPATEMRNFCETGLPHFSYGGPGATPIIRNRQTESILSILVHSNAVGVIIGRCGSTIKEITRQTGVRVHVKSKCNFDSMEQVIIIKGNPENCTNACLNILEILQQNANNTCSSDVVLKILIPDNIIGIIIEEEGNMIKKIMSETETKINVSSITDITIDSFNYRTICTIEGSLQNTSKAEGQISAKLRQSIEHFLHSVDDNKLIRLLKSEMTNKKYNLIIVGPSNVGKSSIVKRYCNNTYQFTKPTIGMDIQQIFVRFNNETIHLEIRDTAGTEDYQSVASSYKGAHGVFFVYDITDFDSSFKLDGWIKDIKTLSDTNSVIILIGSKCDDETNRKISIKKGQRIAKVYRIPFFEVSSKTNLNIDKLFYTIISRIDDLQKQPTDINKELMHTNDTMKPKLDSDVKPNTIPVHCPKMKKEIPDIANTEDDDSQHYKLRRVQPEAANKKFKLIIVGHSNVGKSTIIHRLCKNIYEDTIKTTISMDYHEIFVTFKNKTIQLNIWEAAGAEKYRSLVHAYYSIHLYRGAQGVFIVYDITNSNSLLKLNDWITDIEKFSDLNAVKILIGSKCDDKSNRAISIEEGQKIAERFGIPFFEVSSKTNLNIDKLFYTIISRIDDLQKQPTDINKELMHTNDTMKPKLDSDVKPNTIPVHCPKMKKEIPDIANTEDDDSQHYKLRRVQPKAANKKFKLIIVGDLNVGKSTIINHFCNGVYQDTVPTAGMDYHEIFVTFKNKTIQLIIRDTAGTEKYRSLVHSYYRGAQGVFIVYDITNSNSLFKLNDWITDIEKFSDLNAVKILIGSKCDDKSNRAISIEEGQKIAEWFGIPFFEVSSKTNVNIDKLLYTMISKIHELEPGALQAIDEDLIILDDIEEKKEGELPQ